MALDALVVLGCRVSDANVLSGAALRRARRAAEAYRDGLAPRIVASGGKLWNGFPEADAFARTLSTLGVPRSAVICELWSESTIENARYVAKLARRVGLAELGVVTCDWHMARAVSAFRRHGFEVVPVPARAPAAAVSARAVRYASERVHALFDRLAVAIEGTE